ncbi:MAG TPA: hypothetical protein VL346_11425 [Acidobacteriaceae bacterium]|nr:hypothetical protein [Acidobacteriaceae bacterium]
MRTTIDIPDETYKELRILAAERRESIRKLVLDGIQLVRQQNLRPTKKKFIVPVIRSSRPGALKLTNEEIDELISFT